eukprot:2614957-Pleurochrysis_carterae.AAC.1
MPMLLRAWPTRKVLRSVIELDAELQRAKEGRIWGRVRAEEVKRMRAEEASCFLQELVDAERDHQAEGHHGARQALLLQGITEPGKDYTSTETASP